MSDKYDYDLAISYESTNEVIAKNLYDNFKTNFKVFFSPQSQDVLAFTDGLEELSKIFETAKFVVVVYSELWGKTPFTIVERNKIEERFLLEGPGFLFFIKVDKTLKPPWLPKQYFYFDLTQYGMEKAVTIIKFRLIENEASVKEETAIDISQRIKREEEEKRKKERFVYFPGEAQSQALIEYDKLLDIFINEIKTFNGTQGTIPIKSEFVQTYNPGGFRMFLYPLEASIHYHIDASNVLSGSYINFKIFNTRPVQPKALKAEKFTYDYNEIHVYGWSNEKKFFTSDSLVTYMLKELLDHYAKFRDK